MDKAEIHSDDYHQGFQDAIFTTKSETELVRVSLLELQRGFDMLHKQYESVVAELDAYKSGEQAKWLRDQFAMSGLAAGVFTVNKGNVDQVAVDAYLLADALLAARTM